MRVFGEIPDHPPGTHYENRQTLSAAGIHRPTQAGISGSGKEGADSIVVSGGYEDDEDYGEEIIYTGHGGRDPNTGEQVADQELTRGNLALAKSSLWGLPVRVVRGASKELFDPPPIGYRYDGLYYVADHWAETGKSGFLVWRYRLVRDPALVPPQGSSTSDLKVPHRRSSTVERIIRDTAVARQVKAIHSFRCQVCGDALMTAAGPYAEGAHVKPLGKPHNGPDIAENILCLCPNHHVLFDKGAFTIADDLSLIGLHGFLQTSPRHSIGKEYLAYHRKHYYNEQPEGN